MFSQNTVIKNAEVKDLIHWLERITKQETEKTDFEKIFVRKKFALIGKIRCQIQNISLNNSFEAPLEQQYAYFGCKIEFAEEKSIEKFFTSLNAEVNNQQVKSNGLPLVLHYGTCWLNDKSAIKIHSNRLPALAEIEGWIRKFNLEKILDTSLASSPPTLTTVLKEISRIETEIKQLEERKTLLRELARVCIIENVPVTDETQEDESVNKNLLTKS